MPLANAVTLENTGFFDSGIFEKFYHCGIKIYHF